MSASRFPLWVHPRHLRLALAFLLIAVFAVRVLISIRSTGMVTDEFAHIPAGYIHLMEHRFDFNPEHPPLIKLLAALPSLYLKPGIPEYWRHVDNWKDWFAFCTDFFFSSGEKARKIVLWARVPMIVVACLLALLIYHWTGRLFGSAAGLVSLLFFTFEPDVFAHSRFVLTDIGATLAYTSFWYCVWRWLKVPSFWNSALGSLAASVSLLVKHSMVIAPACWVLILLLMMVRKKLRLTRGLEILGMTLITIILVLYAGYGFELKPFDKWGMLPFPGNYLRGLDAVMTHNHQGHPAYLSGEYSTSGWRYYFLLAFLVKVPLPFLLVSTMSLIWLIWFCAKDSPPLTRRGANCQGGVDQGIDLLEQQHPGRGFGSPPPSSSEERSFCLLLPIALYAGIAALSHINIGIRHILPVFPFLCVAAGGLFATLSERRSKFRWLPVGLGVWQAGASLAFASDPLEYFNVLAGGPKNGWRYLADSNVDFGQQFQRLAEYIKMNNLSNPNLYVVGTEYNLLEGVSYNTFLPYRLSDDFRSSFPYLYHESQEPFRPGTYVVSVAKILDPFVFTSSTATPSERASATALLRLLEFKPKTQIGNFVWIYDLSMEDIIRSGLSQFTFYYYDGMKYAGPRK